MPADPAHQLALPELGDTETAVPVSSAEEQTAVVGHHQHLSADLHPGRERSTQETLRSAPQSRKDQSKLGARSKSEPMAQMWRRFIISTLNCHDICKLQPA